MSIEGINRQLERVGYPVSDSWTLPPDCYHDREWFGHELRSVFGAGWIGVGRSDNWKEPGDYESINLGDVSIVIVMDRDGKLQALSNTCLHRGSRIVTGKGKCRALVCPFHGWSYDFSGNLLSAPRMETTQNFDLEDFRLRNFSVEQQDGFVFCNLGGTSGSLENWLGDFPDLHAPWALADMVTGRQRVFDVDCNWKLFIEVFNEYYHLPYVHPDSISDHYPEPMPTEDVIGEYTSQFGETVKNPALLDDDQEHSLPIMENLEAPWCNGARYTWVYPNMSFAVSPDCMWMYHVFPQSPLLTRVVQTICFPATSFETVDFESKADIYYRRFDTAMDEDIPALVRQQAGIQSPYAEQGRFSTLEPSVGNFACWYAEAAGSNGS